MFVNVPIYETTVMNMIMCMDRTMCMDMFLHAKKSSSPIKRV